MDNLLSKKKFTRGWRSEQSFLDDLLSKCFVHCMIQTGMEAWGREGIICFIVCCQTTYFIGAGLWGRKHLNGNMRMWEFFLRITWFKWLYFSYWHEIIGEGSKYLFHSLFSDCIFVLWHMHEDRKVEAAVWVLLWSIFHHIFFIFRISWFQYVFLYIIWFLVLFDCHVHRKHFRTNPDKTGDKRKSYNHFYLLLSLNYNNKACIILILW